MNVPDIDAIFSNRQRTCIPNALPGQDLKAYGFKRLGQFFQGSGVTIHMRLSRNDSPIVARRIPNPRKSDIITENFILQQHALQILERLSIMHERNASIPADSISGHV